MLVKFHLLKKNPKSSICF